MDKDKAIKEIKQLKELLDSGILTQDEYDVKSADLKKIILASAFFTPFTFLDCWEKTKSGSNIKNKIFFILNNLRLIIANVRKHTKGGLATDFVDAEFSFKFSG
mgnify:CR=1 FL=1